ncbi:hypothetical protein ABZ714_16020 [Streptomyces sp. NPDC006798]|uniref:hypothetical protein n=1 Tax=Streptomyces sp. NPDC006798 TaxID=3155462 RepID=UPI0033E11DFA
MTTGEDLNGHSADWVDPRYAELAAHVDREVVLAFRCRTRMPCAQCGALGVRILLPEGAASPLSIPCLAC